MAQVRHWEQIFAKLGRPYDKEMTLDNLVQWDIFSIKVHPAHIPTHTDPPPPPTHIQTHPLTHSRTHSLTHDPPLDRGTPPTPRTP